MKQYKKKSWSGFWPKYVTAVNNVSIGIQEAQTMGLVGESGSGKSTIGELIGDLQKPDKGHVLYKGKDISELSASEYHVYRKNVQFIFQNPQASMNPYFTIKKVLLEPMESLLEDYNRSQAEENIVQMMENIGLDTSYLNKYPRHLSGGQCQRVAIGRALLLNPEIIICDEAVSALDVSVQAQILNLLNELQLKYQTSYLFISHDMATVRYMSDRIGVMFRGDIVEEGLTDQILDDPQHTYTKKLLHYVKLKNS